MQYSAQIIGKMNKNHGNNPEYLVIFCCVKSRTLKFNFHISMCIDLN